MTDKKDISDLLKDDPFGLLAGDRANKPLTEVDSNLITSFEEVQSFVEEHGREPTSNIEDINEYKLFSRLNAIRRDPKKVKALKKYDFSKLLSGPEVKEASVEDLISEDPFGLLVDDSRNEIFNLTHVKPVVRLKPDYLSRRRVCKNFSLYKDMFSTLHQEFDLHKRRLVKYKSEDLAPGKFFSLGGVLLFFQSIVGKVETKKFSSGDRDRFDGKTLCIFDNGTESDMLFRSLDKALLADGYSISEALVDGSIDGAHEDSANDVFNGYIYVLKSHNKNVKHIEDLYKIGYTAGSVQDRIKNAKNEGTYLFDSVDIVATYRCLNTPSYDLEQTIHDFFSHVKLDIDLIDNTHHIFRPKEWFQVNLMAIEDAIGLIINGNLSEFSYDEKVRQIIKR